MTIEEKLNWSKLKRTRRFGVGQELAFPGIPWGVKGTGQPGVAFVPDFAQYDEVPSKEVVLSTEQPSPVTPDESLTVSDRYGHFEAIFDCFNLPEKIDPVASLVKLQRHLALWSESSENWSRRSFKIKPPTLKSTKSKFVLCCSSKQAVVAKRLTKKGAELFMWSVGAKQWKNLGVTLSYNSAVAISRNGNFLAAYDTSGTVYCWRIVDMTLATVVLLWKRPVPAEEKKDRRILMDVSTLFVVVVGSDKLIHMFITADGNQCPDIDTVVVPLSLRLGTNDLTVGGFAHSLQVFRRFRVTWIELLQHYIRRVAYTNGAKPLALSGIGSYKLIATSGSRRAFASDEHIFAFEHSPVRPYLRVVENVHCIALEIVGNYLLTLTKTGKLDYEFTINEYATGEVYLKQSIKCDYEVDTEHSLICATASTVVVLLHDGTAHIFELKEGKLEFALEESKK
jgi:hypothetical protein